MTDDVRFEARLTEALGRYAERGPIVVDPAAMTAAVRMAAAPRQRTPFVITRPALLAAAFLLALAAVIVFVGALLTNRPTLPPGGGILLWSGAWTGQGNAYVVDADGRAIQTATLAGIRHCPHLTSDGPSIDYWTNDGSLRQVAGGGSQATSRLLGSFSFRVVGRDIWSDDGRWIAFPEVDLPGATTRAVAVVSTADGTTTRIGSSEAGGISAVAWAPDGDRLALARQLGPEIGVENVSGPAISIETVNRDGSDLRPLTRLPYDTGSSGYPELVWSTDGRRIGVAAPPGGPLIALDAATGQAASATDDPRFSASVRSFVSWVSPDGSRIARIDLEDLVITDARGREVVRQRLGGPSQELAWSPNSRALAVSRAPTGDAIWLDIYGAAGDRPPTNVGPFAGTFDRPTCMNWLEG